MIAPQIDPVIFGFGPIQVRWYGLMYVIGFILGSYLLKRLARNGYFQVPLDKVENLVTYVMVCMFIGARLAYVFIYNWDYYSDNMGDIIAIWKGGLSFHGALAGILIAGYLFARSYRIPWGQVMDVIALAGAQGLLWGRIGNFINHELYGRVTTMPWGMIFVGGGPYPRHPSQLYEGVMEGIILSAILWFVMKRTKYYGIVASLFMVGYGVFRFIVEFFREPDTQLGYFFGGTMTMGQILCFVMILLGFVGLWFTAHLKLWPRTQKA